MEKVRILKTQRMGILHKEAVETDAVKTSKRNAMYKMTVKTKCDFIHDPLSKYIKGAHFEVDT